MCLAGQWATSIGFLMFLGTKLRALLSLDAANQMLAEAILFSGSTWLQRKWLPLCWNHMVNVQRHKNGWVYLRKAACHMDTGAGSSHISRKALSMFSAKEMMGLSATSPSVTLIYWFSNFSIHRNHLGSLLKCSKGPHLTFWFRKPGVGPKHLHF